MNCALTPINYALTVTICVLDGKWRLFSIYTAPIGIGGDNTSREPWAITTDRGEAAMQCIACKTELPEGATLCRACHTYQRPLRRYLQTSGVAVTVLSVLTSAVLFIWEKVGELTDEWYPPDIQVIAFSSQRDSVFFNPGVTEMFLTELRIATRDLPREQSWVVPVYKAIPPRSHLAMHGDPAPTWEYQWGNRENWETLQMGRQEIAEMTTWRECVVMDFVMRGSRQYRDIMEELGDIKVETFAAQATLERDGRSGEVVAASFPVVGFVVWKNEPPHCSNFPEHATPARYD